MNEEQRGKFCDWVRSLGLDPMKMTPEYRVTSYNGLHLFEPEIILTNEQYLEYSKMVTSE